MTRPDPGQVRRYRELQTIIQAATDEQKTIKHDWITTLGVGRHGDLTISPARRFSPELARQWVEANAPDLLPAITETVISTAKTKAVLPPAVYEQMMTPLGDPRVTLK